MTGTKISMYLLCDKLRRSGHKKGGWKEDEKLMETQFQE